MKTIYATLMLILLSRLLFSTEQTPEIVFPDHHLCLEASGKLVVKADKAVFSFVSKGYGSSLRTAVSDAKSKVGDITNALKTIGIADSCFTTSSFTSGKSLNTAFLSDKKDFNAVLTTTISLRDINKLDEAILILADNKVGILSDITYSLDDQSKARQKAREIALKRVTEQRDTISKILGVNITDVLLIDEAPFETLPWSQQQMYGYPGDRNKFSGVVNSVTMYEAANSTDGNPEGSGGFFAPSITVETQVRVLYRVGLQQK